jgi:DNA-binding CsgD family transcriptional regulator
MRRRKGVTGEPHAVERLTALEISTLRHVLDHRTAKEIARIENVSEDAIVNRINRARGKLGGVSRVEAARLVERHFGSAGRTTIASHPLVSHSMGGDAAVAIQHVDGVPMQPPRQDDASGFGWPFPTRNRPINDDPLVARMAWPIGLAFLTVLALVMLNTVLQSLNNLRL